MELPFPGPAQPRVAVAAGEPAQADPGHRLEGATAVVRALSPARPHRQAGQHRHHRDRPRTRGLRLGHRPAGDGDDRLIAQRPMIAAKGGASEPLNLGLPGKAGGAVAVRRTLASTICRIADPTLVARPRQLRDVSTVMRFRPAHQSMIYRRHDGRASCLAWYSPKQALERKPRIYAPATWKGGHESGASPCRATYPPALFLLALSPG